MPNAMKLRGDRRIRARRVDAMKWHVIGANQWFACAEIPYDREQGELSRSSVQQAIYSGRRMGWRETVKQTDSHNNVRAARALLDELEEQREPLGQGDEGDITAMMAALDLLMMHMPDDPAGDLMDEFERIVNTLHTANELLVSRNATGAAQSLAMANSRIKRLTDLIE